MKFKDGKTFSAYVRSKLHSGYITGIHIMKRVDRSIDTLSSAVQYIHNNNNKREIKCKYSICT